MEKTKKLHNYINKNKYNITIIAVITALLITLSAIYTPSVYTDLFNAFKAFFINLYNTIISLFGKEVEFYKLEIPINAPPIFLPPTDGGGSSDTGQAIIFDIISAKWAIFGNLLISGNHYIFILKELAYYVLLIITSSIPIISIIYFDFKLIARFYFRGNKRHGEDTKALTVWNTFSNNILSAIITAVKATYNAFKASKLKNIVIIAFLLATNAFTFIFAILNTIVSSLGIVVQTKFEQNTTSIFLLNIAYIFYTLRYLSMYLPVLIPIILYYLNKKRYAIAVNCLETFEKHNQEVLAKCDISTFLFGAMGTCKTSSLTSDALSLSVMDTQKAHKLKLECQNKFPFFNWLLFEKDIEKQIKKKKIRNWAGCNLYVEEIEYLYKHNEHKLYKYNKRYGMEHYDGIVNSSIFKVLKDYARLHFLYICDGSFILSNYPIREDKVRKTVGNTVKYEYSFFKFRKNYKEVSYYSRILNFELLRLGKSFDDLVEDKGLEFGVICIAEADKEQINAVEGINDSPNSPYPNPKNDGMSRNEKLIRHRATVMGHCFVHLIKDGQRVMSINADTREISSVQEMQRPSKEKNTLPLFNVIEKPIYYAFNALYKRFNDKITYVRGDNTLLHHFLKFINAKLYNWQNIKYNRYTYFKIKRLSEKGTLDGKQELLTFYQCRAKVFADRYNTASYEPFFNDLAIKANKGIMDYDSYNDTTMTNEEFDKQKSYNRKNMADPLWKERIKEEYKAKLEAEKEERRKKRGNEL